MRFTPGAQYALHIIRSIRGPGLQSHHELGQPREILGAEVRLALGQRDERVRRR
jgi:hypothetical protein